MGNIKSLIYCILHKIKSITKYLYLNFKCILECGAHIATILVAIIAIITLWKNIDSIKDFFEISNLKNTISRLNDENSRLKNDISTKNAIMTFYDIEINTKEKEIEEKIKKIENLNEDIKRHEYTRDKLISNNICLERENIILTQKLKDLNIKLSITDKKYIDTISKKERYIYVSILTIDTFMDFCGIISNINEIAKKGNEEHMLLEINNIKSVYEILKNNIHKYKINPQLLPSIPKKNVINLSLFYDKKIETIQSLKNLSIHLELKDLFAQSIEDIDKIFDKDNIKNKGEYKIETIQKAYAYVDNIVNKRVKQIFLNYKNQFRMIIDQLYDDTI